MIEIKAVEKDSELAKKLLRYVEECSWDDCKDHIAYTKSMGMHLSEIL